MFNLFMCATGTLLFIANGGPITLALALWFGHDWAKGRNLKDV